MRHAWERLEQGDRLQASEKCWGAVVHALKAVSERRGWRHRSHIHNNIIANHLSELTGDDLIYGLYRGVQALHVNYYDDVFTDDELRRDLKLASDLLERIAAADRRIGPDAPAPSYDRRARRASG